MVGFAKIRRRRSRASGETELKARMPAGQVAGGAEARQATTAISR